MTTPAETLTVADFEVRYRHEKPYYEYWHGEAVQKAMPTWIHGLLQIILGELLTRAGFKTGSEVKLKIDPELQLIPDLVATRGTIESAYPRRALEVVIEILSDDDSMSRMLSKCGIYQGWGFEEIYVVEPVTRAVFRWLGDRLEQVDTIADVPVRDVWQALDQRVGV